MRLHNGDPIPTVVRGDTIRVIDGGRPGMGYRGEFVKVTEVQNAGTGRRPNWWIGGSFLSAPSSLWGEEFDDEPFLSFWMENVEVIG